jgi:molybdopterin converting factor small subunit
MKVQVQYMAQLRQAVGVRAEEIEMAGPCSVHALLGMLVGRHGDCLGRLLLNGQGGLDATILVFVGDDQVGQPKGYLLREDDVVTLVSPIAGGEPIPRTGVPCRWLHGNL